jgi:Urea transporter/Peptidase family M23
MWPPAQPAPPGEIVHARLDPADYTPRLLSVVLPPARGGFVDARAAVTRVVAVLGPALGNVFLIPQPWIGMILWLALAWDVRRAAFGLVGLGVAFVGSRALGIGDEHRAGGGLKANALLAALSVSWMTAPTNYALHIQIMMAAVAAAVAFAITAAIMRAMRKADFPTLLWGYCIVAGTTFLIFPKGTWLALQTTSWWWLPPTTEVAWATDFFRSIGSLLFSPTIETGVLVVCAILLWSRVAFVAGLVGWAAGSGVALGFQSLGVTYYWLPAAHNFFVAGMAFGACFILPAYSSLLLAGLAGAGASFIAVALQYLFPAFAYLPMASGLTIWIGIGMLSLAGDRSGFWRNRSPLSMPEEAWWRETYWAERLGRGEPLLVVPLVGIAEITQGFSGTLSHFGTCRYALDFQRPPSLNLADSTIWKAAVTAPAAGVVERVRVDIADNPLGVCNYAESWGNFVCIRLDKGGYALLAHFQQSSIAVEPGSRVEIGSYLGAVGNSGRSPVPHLHLQVQSTAELGAPTVPFRLANYRSGDAETLLEWNAAAVPAKGTLVMVAAPEPAVHSMLASLAPGSAIWAVDRQGKVPRFYRERGSDISLQVEVRLDERGQHRLSCLDGSSLVLSLDADAWRAVEQRGDSPFLRLLTLVAPSIPYAARMGISWSDTVPAVPVGLTRWIKLPLTPYRARPFIHSRSSCIKEPNPHSRTLTIETVLGPPHRSLPNKITCTFDLVRGPVRIEATFDHGSLSYSLVSFDPRSPFRDEKTS